MVPPDWKVTDNVRKNMIKNKGYCILFTQPFINVVKKADTYISRILFEKRTKKYKYLRISKILISASGTIGKTVIFNGENAYFQDSNIVWIKHDKVKILNKYLFYFYQTVGWGIEKGGRIKGFYNNLKKLVIPILSLPE